MVPLNFVVLPNLDFCSKCSQNFSGCSLARACIFLQVLACSVSSGCSFLKLVVAREANFCKCSCSQRKTLRLCARKGHSVPLRMAWGSTDRDYPQMVWGSDNLSPVGDWSLKLKEVLSSGLESRDILPQKFHVFQPFFACMTCLQHLFSGSIAF